MAEQARRTLGLGSDFASLREVPLPIAHTALGVAACACAALVRVPLLGLTRGGLATALVAAATGLTIAIYDRLVYPAEERPGPDTVALPVAAVGAFGIVLALTAFLPLRLLCAAVTVATIGGVPHIGELRVAGRETSILRLARDAAGVLLVIPYLLLGAATTVSLPVRLATCVAGLFLITYDSLRTETLSRRSAAGSAVLAAAGVAAGVLIEAALPGGGPGVRSAVLLLVWYGIRGLAASLLAGRRGVLLVIEYVAISAAGLLALAWVGAGR